MPEFIKRVAVASSNLAEAGYEKKVMAVLFRSHVLWHYLGVPREIYDEFVASPSKGSYFSRVIRARYQALRICQTCGKPEDGQGQEVACECPFPTV